ncbi:signal peptidase [Arsukibacterium ikkense]|uniref:Signal peptidase n=1 Tax=Arsukibacterium ikkense TaxID=336831 RepID=A0A0M2UZD6_9GAMM|nr:signal peptide peptidase SppA [Arsukibacterium ikkense]KKO43917.1 signal peptidase [Arsukibacterium ikkense]
MSEPRKGPIRRFFGAIWRVYKGFRSTVLNLLFIFIVAIIVIAIFSGDDKVKIANTSALVLNLNGDLVEEKRWVDPFSGIINQGLGAPEDSPEMLVSDVVKVIETATTDNRIQVMVLDVSGLRSASMDKMQRVGMAIEGFKTAGKKVFSHGAFYGQTQYYLASYADEISLSPMGAVILEGYGSYPMFYKEALEKLKINTHVFRVGTYKSAVEPYLRNDMSDEAKEANIAWLSDLWDTYKLHVSSRRGFELNTFDESYEALLQKLQAADGDTAQYAINNHFVDNLATREQFRQKLISIVGENDKHVYNHVGFEDYAKYAIASADFVNPLTSKVAVVVARGIIVDGNAKAGTIGGDSTAALLRKARFDDKVKAVVLRIDSGGGSAFASEVIGQEISLLREAGKPVIASMGAVAASGGYWIAAPANEIWASPTTITGSIGIFGLLHTLENSLAALGLNVDGVGTTELAGLSQGLPLYQGLNSKAKDVFQLLIERGYTEFLAMVGSNRNMSVAEVDAVAQGRVWTGSKALELGLVDKLGSFDDAIAAAAEKAGLTHYDVQVIKQELTPTEKMLKDLFGSAKAKGWLPQLQATPEQQMLQRVSKQLRQDFVILNQFNDPNGIYSYCVTCSIN